MEQWYVLYTEPGRESDAVSLIQKKIPPSLYSACRILRKQKVFRSRGTLHILEDVMFPGYLFVKTADSKQLADELKKAREFPKIIKAEGKICVPVEQKDMEFLKQICGEELDKTMGVSEIRLDGGSRIESAKGILNGYLAQIVKLNLHKRFAVVDVELFHRRQQVLFGLSLEQDGTDRERERKGRNE